MYASSYINTVTGSTADLVAMIGYRNISDKDNFKADIILLESHGKDDDDNEDGNNDDSDDDDYMMLDFWRILAVRIIFIAYDFNGVMTTMMKVIMMVML